jgi:predicted nucleotidyltransferase
MTVVEAQLETFVAEVVDTIEAYGPPVLGAYILGSALLGGFDPRSSDLDLVAVAARRLTSSERSAVTHALDALTPPVRKLELVVYVAGAKPPSYELNYPDGDSEPPHWFVLDAAIAQERATPFTGQPWERLLEPVSAEETRRAAEELLRWAEARDDETRRTHAVRARHYLEHGQWITKKEAGA